MRTIPAAPLAREVVLIGGGHSHALMARMAGMNPWPGVQVTLISDVSHAPYSGMVPGHLAGHYSWEETHIDLRRLCSWAGVRFIHARVIGLDLQARRVQVADRPPIAFDWASLNIGSTPAVDSVPGAAEHAIPAKPVPGFLAAWESLRREAEQRTVRALIVGAGAGGVEVALAMKARLGSALDMTLVHQGNSILPTHSPGVRRRLLAALNQAGVTLITGTAVIAVRPGLVELRDGRQLQSDATFWTTQASAPPWLRASGLAVDDHGFVMVAPTLQSVSHPEIFAAGDCASVRDSTRPKSGVFAVRAARPLFENLQHLLSGRPLRRWHPQKHFLSLIGTGHGQAVVSRAAWAAKGAWAWQWKDRIDRAFMRKFADLPAMGRIAPRPSGLPASSTGNPLEQEAAMRCLGCAGKVGATILQPVLSTLRHSHPAVVSTPSDRTDILAGLDTPDDAAVFLPPPGHAMVQTTDHLSALVPDPFLFGRIAAIHSMSDILAMGATPHSALVTALVPFAAPRITREWLTQSLSGVATELENLGALILGGHTAEAPAHALTLTCTGFAPPASLWRKNGLRPDTTLILTKPLGTGILFAAAMRHQANAQWIDAALASMLVSNHQAARLARLHGAIAATDVTGFGLVGHLSEMLVASRTSAELSLPSLPILPGATQCASRGLLSSLHKDNALALAPLSPPQHAALHPHFPLLADPQTSGGLLLAIPAHQAPALLHALHLADCPHAAVIGRVLPHHPESPLITFSQP